MYQKSKIRDQSVNHVMGWAPTLIQMGGSMLENSKREVSMDEESIPGRMDEFMLENSKMAKGMVREPLLGQRERFKEDIGRTANF
jgi:hypothetical protein